MAESTYKSDALTAVIDWDINQITDAIEGVVLADVSIYTYTPSKLDINERFHFIQDDVYYAFTLRKDERYTIATKCLLGVYSTITVEMSYVTLGNKETRIARRTE